ncbi:hypothetical protein PDO_0984 [Rhizobium sp. PDO1-076]|uniref:hypothetical protein n=1 Tax=Rhizobium sp. PDO1-076 TaxID=1125979 RepID=UPI00024E2534|nr:hypothetical protein [Rhizobium sp. PDO1-076]EHS53802.1 hypothetical protein PDO_0984 [Rhizobium sp. PDO1-076]
MVEIYAAMAVEALRERNTQNPRVEEEAFYQAYRESWWTRLSKAWSAKRRKQAVAKAKANAEREWCRDGQPAE